jgi:hypothetical protein
VWATADAWFAADVAKDAGAAGTCRSHAAIGLETNVLEIMSHPGSHNTDVAFRFPPSEVFGGRHGETEAPAQSDAISYQVVKQLRLMECLSSGARIMTKNLGNGRYVPPSEAKGTLFSKVAPALFPLVVAALGLLVGRQFFGM